MLPKHGEFLFGFFQHPTCALHPPCRNHEPLCETTFPHGCVVEPFPPAHPPLYSSLALFDKVQSGETPGSNQRTMERKPIKKCGENLENGQNKVSLLGRRSTQWTTRKHKKTQFFSTPRCRRFQRFACFSPRPVPNGQNKKPFLPLVPFQGSQTFDLKGPDLQDTWINRRLCQMEIF